ncbi:CPBP family intramembrane glutamic endopeptidase [Roseburia hominis]
MENSRKRIRISWFLLGVLPFVISLGIQIVAVMVGSEVTRDMGMYMVFYQVLAIPIFGLWYYLGEGKKQGFRSTKEGLRQGFGLLVVTALALQFGSSLFLIFAQIVMPGFMQEYLELVETSGLGSLTFSMIFYTVILAPIGEELIFRGVTMRYFKGASGKFWIANVLQAALFGLYHMNVIQGLYTFILGLAMGYAVRTYGTVTAGIVMHIVINGSGYLLMNVQIPAVFTLALEVAGAVIAVWGICKMKEKKRAEEEREMSEMTGDE